MTDLALQAALAALEPFATFATANVDGSGWNDASVSSCRERIVDWFGPSDFRRAREAYEALSLQVQQTSAASVPQAAQSLADPTHDSGEFPMMRGGTAHG